jgi:glycosyltransferase involved in cell wall biosynthesis
VPKLLFVVPHLTNSTRLLADYLRYLDKQFEVTLYALDADAQLGSEFPDDATVIVRRRTGRMLYPLGLAYELFRVARGHDLLVSWVELTTTYALSVAAALRRKPVIGWVHAHLGRVFALNMRPGALHRPLIKLVYPNLNAVVGVSEGVAEDLRDNFRLGSARAIVNGVDLSRCRELAEAPVPENLRHVFERPTLVNVAALHPQKNHHTLFQSSALLRRQNIEHNLLLVGDGPLKDQLAADAKLLGIQDVVHFAGYLENPYPLMRAATAFVMCSRWEGLPLALVEALALGAPVIASDCPSGPREILDHGRYGILVPVGDAHALADALQTVLLDPQRRESMRRLARVGAERFSILPRVEQMEQLFWHTLGRQRPTRAHPRPVPHTRAAA